MRTTWFAGVLAVLVNGPALGETALEKVASAFQKGEFAELLVIAAEVPESSQDFARIQYIVGETQLVLGAADEAEQAFLEVLERRSEAIPAMVGLGRALALQGAFEGAEIQLRAALELDAEDLAAARALGEVRMWTDHNEEARELLEKVYARDQEQPLSARALVELRLRMSQEDRAAETAEAFIAARPDHPMGYFLRALVFERMGELENAITAYQAALKHDDRFLDAHKNLAILAHTQSDTYRIEARNALAMEHYERYFELGGKDPELEKVYEALKRFLGQSRERQQEGGGLEDAFAELLAELVAEAGAPGATAAFQLADGRLGVAATGWADVEVQRPMPETAVMPAGSVGKSFVAAVAMTLVEEGALELDAPIAGYFAGDPWFSGLPNASTLTLRDLLNHGSGITSDVLSQPEVLAAFAASIRGGVALGLGHEDLVRGLAGQPAGFAAGEGFAYSDANYVIVGLLLERVAKKPYEALLSERILAPHGLGTVTPTRRDLPGMPAGYRREGATYAELMPEKVTSDGRLVYDPAVEWTGGGLAANVADLARWGRLFFGGRLLSEESMREVIESANGDLGALGFQYGLGVQVFHEGERTLLGHGGWIFGYVTGVLYDPDTDTAIALQINQPTRAYEGILRSLLDLLGRAR